MAVQVCSALPLINHSDHITFVILYNRAHGAACTRTQHIALAHRWACYVASDITVAKRLVANQAHTSELFLTEG